MTPATLSLLTQCLLALAAFASLCLATPRRLQHIPAARPTRWRTPLRVTGFGLLLATTIIAVHHRGWGLGLVDWSAALTLAAFVVIGFATYLPRRLVSLAIVSFILGLGIFIIQ